MALEDIKKKIISDAEKRRDDMIADANKKKERILADYAKQAEDYRKMMTERAKAEGEGLKRGIIIDARQKIKNELLSKKREIIAEVVDTAKQEFIDSKDYVEIITGLVKKAVVTGDEELIISDKEKTLDDKWLAKLNKDINGKLVFADYKGKFTGGVILQKDDSFVNITVDTLYEIIREDIESEIAAILFK